MQLCYKVKGNSFWRWVNYLCWEGMHNFEKKISKFFPTMVGIYMLERRFSKHLVERQNPKASIIFGELINEVNVDDLLRTIFNHGVHLHGLTLPYTWKNNIKDKYPHLLLLIWWLRFILRSGGNRMKLFDFEIGSLDSHTTILEAEYFHAKHAYFFNDFYGGKKIIALKICRYACQ